MDDDLGGQLGRASTAAEALNGHHSAICAALLDAVVAEVAEHGYAAATVEAICERAGCAPATFDLLFTDKGSCFLAAAREFVDRLVCRLAEALRAARNPEEATRGGLAAVLDYLAAHPRAARAFLVEGLLAGPEALAARDLALRTIAELIDTHRGRGRSDGGGSAPVGMAAEAGVGGIYGIVTTRIRRGETESLPGLLSSLAYFLLAPIADPAEPLTLHTLGRNI